MTCSTNTWPHIDDSLTQLVALNANIEIDCAAFGLPAALARHRVALYAAMDALGGWIDAFLAM